MTRLTGIALAAIAGAALATLPIAGQGQAKGKGKDAAKANPAVVHAPVPRAADGKPDLTGTWQSGGVSINGEAGAPPLHPLPPIDNHPIRREPLVYKRSGKRSARSSMSRWTIQLYSAYCLACHGSRRCPCRWKSCKHPRKS